MRAGVVDTVLRRGGDDDAAVFERARQLGFTGVEVVLRRGDLESGRLESLRRARVATGVEVPSLVLGFHNEDGGIADAEPGVARRAAGDVRLPAPASLDDQSPSEQRQLGTNGFGNSVDDRGIEVDEAEAAFRREELGFELREIALADFRIDVDFADAENDCTGNVGVGKPRGAVEREGDVDTFADRT
jgi:hypothetical protein